MAYFVGKYAAFVLDGTPYCLTDYNLEINSEPVDLTTFCSIGQAGTVVGAVAGVNTVVGGIIGGNFTASGPYTGVAPVVGDIVSIVFYLASPTGPSFTQTFLITSVRIATNVRDKATIELAGDLTALATNL